MTPELSIPIGGLAMGFGVGAGRLGVRYRLNGTVALGGGLGGGGSNTPGYGLVDLELVTGKRWDTVGLSFAFRPTVAFPHVIITLPVEFGLAFYVDDAVAITLMLHGGWQQSAGFFFGGGAGLAFNF